MNEFLQWYTVAVLTFLFLGEAFRVGRWALAAFRLWRLRQTPEYKALEAMLRGGTPRPANDNVVRIDSGFLQVPPRGRQ